MNRKLWLCAVVGALVGATSLQTVHVIGDRNSRELFGQRLRCKALADKYEKEYSNPYYTVGIDRVEFSSSRGSCIASTDEQLGPVQKVSKDWMYKVVDLLSGETITVLPCSGPDECAQRLQERNKRLRRLVDWRGTPEGEFIASSEG